MNPVAAGIVAAIVSLAALAPGASAQNNPPVRRVLALDLSRVAPFHRTFDVVVHHRDSSVVVGTRAVSLTAHTLGGVDGWLLTEHRSGAVSAAETLFVAPDIRPITWSSWLGPARLSVAFVGDTIMGATTVGTTKQNVLLAGRPDLLVSGPMVELVLGLLPLEAQWSDSAAVLAIGVSERSILPVELVLLGEEAIAIDSLAYRRAHVIALRTEQRSALYWVDIETHAVLRMQQVVPPHVGMLLEYRLNIESVEAPLW